MVSAANPKRDRNSDGANFLFLVVKKGGKKGGEGDRKQRQKEKEKDEKNSPKDGDNDGEGMSCVQQEFQDGFA